MSIQRIEPDRTRVAQLCSKLKDLLELTLLRDPSLNTEEMKEVRAIRKELEEMGLILKWDANILGMNGGKQKVIVDVTTWIPKNRTIQ